MRNILFALGWIVSIAVVFKLGYESSSEPKGAIEGKKLPSATFSAIAPSLESIEVSVDPYISNPEDFSVQAFEALMDSTPLDVFANPRLRHFLETVPLDQFEALIDAVQRRRWVDAHSGAMILSILYSRWAQDDIDGAMQSAYNMREPYMRDQVLAVALGEYSAQDPEGAFDYYKAYLHGEAHMNNQMGGVAIKSLASVDPQRALAELSLFMQNGEKPGSMTNGLARGLLSKMSAEQALTLTEGMEDVDSRREIIRAILNNDMWQNEEPEVTVRLIENLKPEDQALATERFLKGWVTKDGKGAMDWLTRPENQTLRTQWLPELAKNWVSWDVTVASEWLNQQSITPELDPAVDQLVRVILRKGDDADTAFSWALSMTDQSSERQALAAQSLKKWLEQGAESEEVRTMIEQAKLKEEERRILSTVLSRHEKGS